MNTVYRMVCGLSSILIVTAMCCLKLQHKLYRAIITMAATLNGLQQPNTEVVHGHMHTNNKSAYCVLVLVDFSCYCPLCKAVT